MALVLDLDNPWAQLRRHIFNFEHALALIPSEQNLRGSLPLLKAHSDPVVCSALDQLIRSVAQVDVLVPQKHHQLVSSLIRMLCRRLDAIEVRLDVYTRLALWERLWLTLHREQMSHQSMTWCWQHCVDVSFAIAHIGKALKKDPLWSPAYVRQQRDSFDAEEAMVALINHRSSETHFTASRAPLDADILHGIDLSIKCTNPSARAWVQFSLSAEQEINSQKLRRLKQSPATIFLSPWTLARYLGDQTQKQQDHFWDAFEVNSPRTLKVQSRLIALALASVCKRINTTPMSLQTALLQIPERELDHLVICFLRDHIGRRSHRPYRPHKSLPSVSEVLESEVRMEVAKYSKLFKL